MAMPLLITLFPSHYSHYSGNLSEGEMIQALPRFKGNSGSNPEKIARMGRI